MLVKGLALIRCPILVEVAIHSFATLSSLVTAVDRGVCEGCLPIDLCSRAGIALKGSYSYSPCTVLTGFSMYRN